MDLQHVVTNTKTGAAVATTTTTTGLGTFLDWIPSDIGKLATLVGILLSLTLIYVHVAREMRDRRREALELALLRDKESNRQCDDPSR